MADPNTTTVNGIKIDEVKAKKLLTWLIHAETKNVKTREKNDQEMVAAIQKKIEEVVKCY